MRPFTRTAGTLLAVVAIVAAFQSSTSANHSWGGYHWARTSNPFTVKLGDNVSSTWKSFLGSASSDWTNGAASWGYPDVLDAPVVPGGTNPKPCKATSGQVQVCSSTYGYTGWLGVAQIWASGLHITQGTVKLNDTYFRSAPYNTSAWRQLVACQEIGHTFGLDHQDENFSNSNLGTCMDYTNDPSTNQHPNGHDFEVLAIIYQQLDSTTTLKLSPQFSNAEPGSPSEWGQLMKVSHGGKTQIFERDFGNGERIITFVIWA